MIIRAKYDGTCADCGGEIAAGDPIEWSQDQPARHMTCPEPAAQETPGPAREEQSETSAPAARLVLNGDRYICCCDYQDREVPKEAGFWWDQDRKEWYTTDRSIAVRLIRSAEPEARARLQAVKQAIEQSRAAEATIDVPAPDGLAYLPFQRAGIAYALARESTLLADSMGLGKTIQALGVINADPKIRTVLIIVPASLRINWRREAEKWLVRPRNIYVVENQDPIPSSAKIVIVNYDRIKGPVFYTLMARRWDLLVCDEAHKLKNPKTKRTERVLGVATKKKSKRIPGLVDQCRRKLMLTGTPILNKPVELQPILAAMLPDEFGNFFKFAIRYAAAHQTRFGWDFSGASHLDELQDRLRSLVMIRRLKKDVLPELPAKRRQVVEMAPNGATAAVQAESEAYRQHGAEQLACLRDEADLAHAAGDDAAYRTAVERLTSAPRIAFAKIAEARHALAIAKIPAVLDHVDDVLEGGTQKLVVFAHHKAVVAALADHYGDAAVTLTGDTAQQARQDAVDRFQTDPSVKVFVGSITAAGVGLTLTAASHVVFAELDWTPANVTQAEDRLHRIGQTESVLVQHLVVDGSLDARTARVLIAKQEVADLALDTRAEKASAEVTVVVPTDDKSRARRPRSYPKATDMQRKAAATGLQSLSGVCDGAHAIDGCGFNKFDSRVGKELAEKSRTRSLTDGQVWLARKILAKYHRQLGTELVAELKKEEER